MQKNGHRVDPLMVRSLDAPDAWAVGHVVAARRNGEAEMASKAVTPVELLMRYLEAEGVGYIFGIPGGPLMPLYEAMFDHGGIRPIITKHEEGASFMADG